MATSPASLRIPTWNQTVARRFDDLLLLSVSVGRTGAAYLSDAGIHLVDWIYISQHLLVLIAVTSSACCAGSLAIRQRGRRVSYSYPYASGWRGSRGCRASLRGPALDLSS
jgi:hypothetical protein